MALPEYQGKRNISPSQAKPNDFILNSGTENLSPRYEAVNAGQSQVNQMQSGMNEAASESSDPPPLIVDNGNVNYESVQG
jgi:hypothetical protein